MKFAEVAAALLATCAALTGAGALLVRSDAALRQAGAAREQELLAKGRVFPEVGAGVAGLKAKGAGEERRYYLLVSRPGEGSRALVLRPDGTRVAQIPAPISSGGARETAESRAVGQGTKDSGAHPEAAATKPGEAEGISYGQDFDLDAAGNVVVADRGANAVKVFSPEGKLVRMIRVTAPTSVAALSDGELAVTSLRSRRLVTVYNTQGKIAREFIEPVAVTESDESKELNRFLNIGRLAADSASHIYYAFTHMPEPTVRMYDRYGYLQYEIELATLEFQPAAQAARRRIELLSRSRFPIGEARLPTIKPTVTSIAADEQTGELWVAMGAVLLRFDREGGRTGTYRLFTQEGLRVEASAILVEPTRLLVASDELGIYEFPRPDRERR